MRLQPPVSAVRQPGDPPHRAVGDRSARVHGGGGRREPELIKTGIGLFVPGTPLASDVGVAMMQGPKDPAKLKAELAAAGYKGEKVVLLAASDFPVISALALVGGDLLKRIGFNVDYQSLDWGTVVQRRASREPIDKGGWNMFFTYGGGTGNVSPASLTVIRSRSGTRPGSAGRTIRRWRRCGLPGTTRRTSRRSRSSAAEMQAQLFENPSYAPLGLFYQPTVFRSDLKDIPEGIPQFYRVRRAGMTPHVVVIGAGIVGAATAIELLRDGHRVTILEPGEPGGEQAASYGNGTLLNPSSVIPMSSPGIWRKVPGWLADPLGPLAIRWRYLPRLLPWLTRFLRAGATEAKVAATARALRPLVLDAPERHRRLAEEAGVGELITRQGVLFVFPTRADFEAEELAWRIRRENGVRWLELSADELRQREPGLDRRYTFGVLVEENGQCRDPGAYVAALVRHAQALGAELRREQGARLSHRGAAAARGAHRRGRDRSGQGGDRRRGLVEDTGRRRRRSRAAGDRAWLPRASSRTQALRRAIR